MASTSASLFFRDCLDSATVHQLLLVEVIPNSNATALGLQHRVHSDIVISSPSGDLRHDGMTALEPGDSLSRKLEQIFPEDDHWAFDGSDD